MRDKYANKGMIGKILHKYTGLIIVGVLALIALAAWNHYTSEQVFFESWSCVHIEKMDTEGLTPRETERYNQILKECK